MRYLITFCCFGSHIPGDDGIVSRRNHLVGARREVPNSFLARAVRIQTNPVTLDSQQRDVVLNAILGVCRHRSWTLLAAHVRTNHVHAVVDADTTPERVMIDLKAYASRGLGRKEMWARHGSTIYLWEADEVANAVRYVVSRQGEPMAVYFADWIFTSLS